MYKSLFIDLDDTIWNFTENSRDSFQEVYELYCLNRYFDSFDDFFNVYLQYNHKLWEEYGLGHITKEELNNKRFAYPLTTVGIEDDLLVKNYSQKYLELIPTKKKLMPYVKEALDYLSSKYRLYIISNGFRELQFRKMESAGITHYFDKIILSEDIRVLKPNPEIFYYALSATQSELRYSLMIGDNWTADIEGARGVNMDHAFYYPTDGETKLSFQPTYLIRSWKDIQNIL